ncbi:MAG: polysaccharide deacetylase [Actinobacteria bacterium]|nr:polysaccharide deacetylase [Actinomycetota bacterium]
MALLEGKHKFPVLFTFDVDGETLWISRDRQNLKRPVVLSQGEYGPRYGVPRILNLLKKYEIPATFFVPAWVMERYPRLVEDILAEGHELAHHGYLHEWPDSMSGEEEQETFDRAAEVFERYTGYPPRGYRSPAWEFSQNTLDMLVQRNFLFSSNMMDSEEPYEYVLNGRRSGLVELPVSWILDDAVFFLYSLTTPGRAIFPPASVFQIWESELHTLYHDAFAGCFVLTMHPQLIGRPTRLAVLERLIQSARGLSSIWFATCGELAAFIKQQNELEGRFLKTVKPIGL